VEASTSAIAAAPRKGDRLLTPKQVAELTQLSVKTIYSYAQRGLIDYVPIQSSRRFWESHIFDWLEQLTCRARQVNGAGYFMCKACGSTNVAHVPAGAAKGNGPRPTNGNGAKRRPN
jgi:predicted DNA-binding transcriptional regulator AlpA